MAVYGNEKWTYLAPLTRARAPVSGEPLCLYMSLHCTTIT